MPTNFKWTSTADVVTRKHHKTRVRKAVNKTLTRPKMQRFNIDEKRRVSKTIKPRKSLTLHQRPYCYVIVYIMFLLEILLPRIVAQLCLGYVNQARE